MANNRIADQKRLNEVDIISFKKESESKVGAVIQLCQVGSFYPSTLPTSFVSEVCLRGHKMVAKASRSHQHKGKQYPKQEVGKHIFVYFHRFFSILLHFCLPLNCQD